MEIGGAVCVSRNQERHAHAEEEEAAVYNAARGARVEDGKKVSGARLSI